MLFVHFQNRFGSQNAKEMVIANVINTWSRLKAGCFVSSCSGVTEAVESLWKAPMKWLELKVVLDWWGF